MGRDAQPYEAGNDAATTHGAFSKRKVQPLADAIAEQAASAAPWTQQRVFAPTVQAWAWAEAQATLLRMYVDDRGMLDDDGQPLPALALLDRTEVRAARLRSELGFSPSSWARLIARLGSAKGEAVAHGIAALQEVGRELDRTMRALPGGGDDRTE